MPKIESSGAAFLIDGVPYPKNRCRTFRSGDKVGLMEVGTNNDKAWVHAVIFSAWTNSLDVPYASVDALLLDLANLAFT